MSEICMSRRMGLYITVYPRFGLWDHLEHVMLNVTENLILTGWGDRWRQLLLILQNPWQHRPLVGFGSGAWCFSSRTRFLLICLVCLLWQLLDTKDGSQFHDPKVPVKAPAVRIWFYDLVMFKQGGREFLFQMSQKIEPLTSLTPALSPSPTQEW